MTFEGKEKHTSFQLSGESCAGSGGLRKAPCLSLNTHRHEGIGARRKCPKASEIWGRHDDNHENQRILFPTREKYKPETESSSFCISTLSYFHSLCCFTCYFPLRRHGHPESQHHACWRTALKQQCEGSEFKTTWNRKLTVCFCFFPPFMSWPFLFGLRDRYGEVEGKWIMTLLLNHIFCLLLSESRCSRTSEDV